MAAGVAGSKRATRHRKTEIHTKPGGQRLSWRRVCSHVGCQERILVVDAWFGILMRLVVAPGIFSARSPRRVL